MTESISAHSADEAISQSQISLTQVQRDRIAKQRELALARRSAKTEVLLYSTPSDSSQKDGNQQALPSCGGAAEVLNKVRSFPSLPSKSSLTASSLNPFRKSVRKPFSPPVQIINLEDDGHVNDASFNNVKGVHNRHPFSPPVQIINLEDHGHVNDASFNNVKGVHNSAGCARFSAGNTHPRGALNSFNLDRGTKHDLNSMASIDSEQRASHDLNSMARSGAGQSGNHNLNSMDSNGNTQKRQWLWLPDAKANPKSNITVEAPKGRGVRAQREPQDRKRAKSGSDGFRFENNDDDGWRSVRKRSLAGHIFGQINSETLNKGISHVQNTVMDSVSHINSKLLSTRKPQVKLTLSSQQRKVLLAIAAGKSVFLTGSAGTGKSYLLHEAVYTLKNLYGVNSVFVTASTGLAACAIGGTTLHSFAGIGLGMGEKRELANKVSTIREARKRWIDCKALIIDEVSMIDGELFDKLEYVARAVRGPAFKNKVFGGIQLVVTGDFFQLPPVHPENPEKYFAFQADCWNDCFELQVELTQVFRQSDSEFVKMLNEIRKGQCSSITHLKLSSCDRPVQATNTGILMTKLYPRKMDVGRENGQKLRSLNQDTVAFLAKDESKSEFAMRQLENVRAEKELYLSVGAQVMLVKNVDSSAGLVNGARGVVVRFASVEELDEGKDVAKKLSPSGLWPVVLFACDGVERLLRPESWSIMDGNTEVAKRSQIPLVLAWALSVHKCQGMTLDRVEIDLSKSFEYGMVYVALSRVKCLDGLRLIGFEPSLIKVHSKVVQFYEELKTGDL